ncbi:hypothetical protein EON77_07880 [bacterium]|nr:MAG: hypothetical protein EON77_07880 [bacterium]
MNGARLACALVVLALALASGRAARTAEMEEVVIKGRLERLAELRKAIDAAEDRAYARYNELNDDDAYDIECTDRAPTGRRLTGRYCEPKYVADNGNLEAQKLTNVAIGTGSNVRFQSARELHYAGLYGLQQRMRAIAESDPKMQEELAEKERLQQAYKDLQKKRK